jgi:hypothetical protein
MRVWQQSDAEAVAGEKTSLQMLHMMTLAWFRSRITNFYETKTAVKSDCVSGSKTKNQKQTRLETQHLTYTPLAMHTLHSLCIHYTRYAFTTLAIHTLHSLYIHCTRYLGRCGDFHPKPSFLEHLWLSTTPDLCEPKAASRVVLKLRCTSVGML